MHQPFFSIIIPTYNRANLIQKTIESLLLQTYTNFEIIIVDDGSTDNTEEVVAPYTNERLFYFKKNNAERAAARNFGAIKAKGDYVNFFDSDDLALPHHLEVAGKMIQEKNIPEWFHLGFAFIYPDEKTYNRVASYREEETLNNIIINGNILSCNGVFIKREIALAHPFNETRILSASEDYELWLRLAARFPLYYTNEITSIIVEHDFRSVRVMNPSKIIERQLFFINLILKDKIVNQVFQRKIGVIKMYAFLYIATHLASVKNYKSTSLKFLIKGLFCSPRILKTKGFYATLKNLIFKWKTY